MVQLRDYKVTIDGTKIANKTNLSYKANDGTAKQVSLADGLNFKNGTLTTASIDDAGVVKYDVNTATITKLVQMVPLQVQLQMALQQHKT